MSRVLPIRLVPDDVLRVVCDPVQVFDADLAQLSDAMLATMYAAPGRGLAAPQIGVTKRLFVMDVTWKDGTPAPQVFVNPERIDVSDTVVTQDEGCLSIPGDPTPVTRPAEVELRWQRLDGVAQTGRFTGFAAACVQHEIDHLNGILCTDYAR